MNVKVCGITRKEDAEAAARLGAWALGFVFWPESPRAVTPEQAGRIASGLTGVRKAGVFVDASLDEIKNAVRLSGIDTIQLHGDETPEFCARVAAMFPKLFLIRAMRLQGEDEIPAIQDYRNSCQAILIDAHVEGAQGGTGARADWDLARKAKAHGPIILAGGLNSKNIQDAIRQVDPWGVDLSSGLEESPGIKSYQKMKEFFANVIAG